MVLIFIFVILVSWLCVLVVSFWFDSGCLLVCLGVLFGVWLWCGFLCCGVVCLICLLVMF